MIGFNTLLRDEDINPTKVKLARHQITKLPGKPTPYHLWLADNGRDDGEFNLYQQIQTNPVFEGSDWLASFVVTPLNETLFVGVYAVNGVTDAEHGLIDPISGKDAGASGCHRYNLVQSQKLADYRGRLVIEWGQAFLAWHQWAHKNNKAVIEFRRAVDDPPFPGFLDFRKKLSDLTAVPSTWRIVLSSVSGVYLLSCLDTGKQYVGSAQGAGGFWGRWENYLASGDGGNKLMKEHTTSGYQVSVLEVASSSAGPDDIARMESRWKEKLLSREFGLNAN